MKTKKPLPLIAIALLIPGLIPVLGLAGCGKQTPVASVAVEPGQVTLPFSQVRTVHVTWTPSAAIGEERPTVFVHLLDARKKVARTFDHPFPGRWSEGTPVANGVKLYQSALAPPLPPGRYQVTLGLYGRDGQRWPLEGLGQPVGRGEYNAFQVEVPNENPSPRFAFAPTWMDLETGGDRQVLARRWLLNRAAFRLVDQRQPGAVWMVLQIPSPGVADYKMVLDEGATTPSVLIRGNCGGTETNVTGPGLHEVEVNVDTPPPGDFCHFILSANFALQPLTRTGKARSASLENLAWVPGGGKAGQPATAETSSSQTSSPTSPTSPQ
ncbi:MAG TPA: hypothetical protein VGH73_09505 [Thermoanaerobaculia bacterium]|jgi:hypothetical protein